MLLKNSKADFSYAIKKYKWGGEDGAFESKDLQQWFKVYNKTGLTKVPIINK